MGFEIKTAKAMISNNNSVQVTTRFRQQIQKCIVGIRGFQMTFGNMDHHVKEVGLAVNKKSINGNEIICMADLSLKDSSNHHGTGSVEFCIAALTEVDNADYVLQSGVKYGDSFEKGHGSICKSAVGLSKFGMSYSDASDHHVKDIAIKVFDSSNTLGISGNLADKSNHSCNPADLREASGGCYLGYYGKHNNLIVSSFSLENGAMTNFDGDMNNYGIIITDFELSFPDDDHHVKSIEVGARLHTSGLIEGIATMRDNSGHNQASNSRVSGYVISYLPD